MPSSGVSDLCLHCLLRPVCPNTYDYYGIQTNIGNIMKTLLLSLRTQWALEGKGAS